MTNLLFPRHRDKRISGCVFLKNKTFYFSRGELSEETLVLKMRLLCACVGAFALRRLGRQI